VTTRRSFSKRKTHLRGGGKKRDILNNEKGVIATGFWLSLPPRPYLEKPRFNWGEGRVVAVMNLVTKEEREKCAMGRVTTALGTCTGVSPSDYRARTLIGGNFGGGKNIGASSLSA